LQRSLVLVAAPELQQSLVVAAGHLAQDVAAGHRLSDLWLLVVLVIGCSNYWLLLLVFGCSDHWFLLLHLSYGNHWLSQLVIWLNAQWLLLIVQRCYQYSSLIHCLL
jgi:hypothetical protein